VSNVPAPSGVAEEVSPLSSVFGSAYPPRSRCVRCIGPWPPDVLGSAPWSSQRDSMYDTPSRIFSGTPLTAEARANTACRSRIPSRHRVQSDAAAPGAVASAAPLASSDTMATAAPSLRLLRTTNVLLSNRELPEIVVFVL